MVDEEVPFNLRQVGTKIIKADDDKLQIEQNKIIRAALKPAHLWPNKVNGKSRQKQIGLKEREKMNEIRENQPLNMQNM